MAFDRADVLIEGGASLSVRRDLAAAHADVLDRAGKVVLPGFVNSHHHVFQTALRLFWSDGLDLDFLQSRAGEQALVDGRVVNAGGPLVDVEVPAVADELAESTDGLLRRSGARSIPLSSCRAS